MKSKTPVYLLGCSLVLAGLFCGMPSAVAQAQSECFSPGNGLRRRLPPASPPARWKRTRPPPT